MCVLLFIKTPLGEFVLTDSVALKLRDKLHQTSRSSGQLFLAVYSRGNAFVTLSLRECEDYMPGF